MAFTLGSSTLRDGGSIPTRYARAGAELSPPLTWNEPPPGTRALALIVQDPDATGGTFTHWLLYNLPDTARTLPEGLPRALHLSRPVTGKQGRNDYGTIGYGGPQPPSGEQHRYLFRLFALDAKLDLRAGADVSAVGLELERHAIGVAELTALYP